MVPVTSHVTGTAILTLLQPIMSFIGYHSAADRWRLPARRGRVLGAVGPAGGALLDVADAGNSSPLLNCRVEREGPRRGG